MAENQIIFLPARGDEHNPRPGHTACLSEALDCPLQSFLSKYRTEAPTMHCLTRVSGLRPGASGPFGPGWDATSMYRDLLDYCQIRINCILTPSNCHQLLALSAMAEVGVLVAGDFRVRPGPSPIRRAIPSPGPAGGAGLSLSRVTA